MLSLYNSLTKSKKMFKPINGSKVSMYTCGPTVYDHVHIGNLRSFITADLLQRVLRSVEGYDVDWILNITDVDDKMISKIKKNNPDEEPMQALGKMADTYTDMFISDIESVGIRRADIKKLPRATDHIDSMQELIKRLLREKIAYISEGSVYFSLDAYKKTGKEYGVLVNLDYDPQQRVVDDQDQKNGVGDFALWKARKDDEPSWDFIWIDKNYPGRPGWHIECSAMSTEYLGNIFDIHTGGIDLKFPHHENEIAQCGGQQAKFFIHNEFLNVEGEKMSKSLGNVTTLNDMSDPLAFRLQVLQAHYRSHMDFSVDSLYAAKERLNNLRSYADSMTLAWPGQIPEQDNSGLTKKFLSEFEEALSDDLNTPAALASLNILEGKVYSQETLAALKVVEGILGIGLVDNRDLTSEERALITDYDNTRELKEYVKSDKIRKELIDKYNLSVSDTQFGPLVSRVRD
ncbi:MAG: cysteine--tRNA ligase [Candidatus Saccharibacteria bacterium]